MTVLATSTLVIVAKKEVVADGKNPRSNLAWISYILYSINLRKKSVSVLFHSGSKVNAVYLAVAKDLGLPIKLTDIRDKKIDNITLDTYGMVVAVFSLTNKATQVKFFEKTFLVVNIGPERFLEMFFLTLSGLDVDF